MNLFAPIMLGAMTVIFAVIAIRETLDGLDLSKNFGRGYKRQIDPRNYYFRIFYLFLITYMSGAATFSLITGVTVFPFNLSFSQ